MKAVLNWNEKMNFTALADGHSVSMDAKSPIGQGLAMTPKDLVVVGLGGCTAMDVIALMKKHKQIVNSFQVEVEVETSTGKTPMVFTKADIYFRLEGSLDEAIVLESVRLSQTKYCGVSAMMAKAFPITYHVYINGKDVGTGQADFPN